MSNINTTQRETKYRPGLPPMPGRIARLPIDPDRGYPVPAFVTWIDGKPDFRIIQAEFVDRCVNEKLCWVCGQRLKGDQTFVIGPMCAINRVSAEPPSHFECAEYSAKACPFLTKPHMERRENDKPEGCILPPGEMIRRNPGVTLLWTTKSYGFFSDGNHKRGMLFNIGAPIRIECYREGREATKEEIRESVESGLPILREMAEKQGPVAVEELERMIYIGRELLEIK